MSVLTRIKSIEIDRFRGWGRRDGRPHCVPTDADVVLVTGANGFGKTSLLEAIVLALTGKRVNEPPSEDTPVWSQLAHAGGEEWGIWIHGEFDATPPSPTIEVGWTRAEGYRADAWWQTNLASRANASGGVPDDLLARATAFFQEDPRVALDEAAQKTTLAGWFRPIDEELASERPRSVRDSDTLEEALAAEADYFDGRAALDGQARSQLANAAPELAAAFERFRSAAGSNLPAAAEPTLDGIQRWFEGSLDAVGEESSAGDLPKLVDTLTEKLKRRTLKNPELLDDIDAEIAAIEERLRWLPPSEEGAELLEWASGDEGVDLDRVLSSLATHLERWRGERAPDDPRLMPLLSELRQLDTGWLRALAGVSAAVVGEARESVLARVRKEERLAEARQEREGLLDAALPDLAPAALELGRRINEESRRLDDLASLREAHWRAASAELRGVQRVLDAVLTRGEGSTMEKLDGLVESALDNTLVRFHPRPGFLPISRAKREDASDGRAWQVFTTADGRPWTDLSTGQKAQLNLAWMLAQAEALRPVLPFRVLVLDDTSTAFDQGNLTRQATWLRQLAYHPDEERRWQIFLVSHHDALTTRLAELLRPPEERSLEVLEFKGWQPEVGPTIQPWRMDYGEPRLPGNNAAKRLADALSVLWTEPRNEKQPRMASQ